MNADDVVTSAVGPITDGRATVAVFLVQPAGGGPETHGVVYRPRREGRDGYRVTIRAFGKPLPPVSTEREIKILDQVSSLLGVRFASRKQSAVKRRIDAAARGDIDSVISESLSANAAGEGAP